MGGTDVGGGVCERWCLSAVVVAGGLAESLLWCGAGAVQACVRLCGSVICFSAGGSMWSQWTVAPCSCASVWPAAGRHDAGWATASVLARGWLFWQQ